MQNGTKGKSSTVISGSGVAEFSSVAHMLSAINLIKSDPFVSLAVLVCVFNESL